MASYGWRQNRSVADSLFEEGHLFELHQALRLLESLYRDRVPVGEEVDPEREVVRFRSAVRFDYPASDVDEIKLPEDGQPAEMVVNVMSLAGVLGPLPPWVAERTLERSSRGDTTLRDFLDMFNHRLISLLYRAKKKSRPALDARPPDKGRVSNVLYALMGLGTPHLRGTMGLSERALLPFTAMIAARPRSMAGLERVLRGYFNVEASVVPFRGRWETIEESDVTRIGESGQNQILGQGAVLGRRVFDPETSFEVRVGPLTHKQFLDFLPRRTCARAIAALVRFYAGEELGFTYRLVLHAAQVPELRLGRKGGALLGWTSWLRTRPPERDDSQVRLQGRA